MVDDDSGCGNSSATVVVSKQRKPDVRNLAWKKANVGSKLLSKMGGWQEGQAIGKRQRQRDEVSDGQGLRVTKRPDGWGLGHAISTASSNAAATPHVNDFTNVLASLRQQHEPLLRDQGSVDDDGSKAIDQLESPCTNSVDQQRPRKKKRLSTDEPRPNKKRSKKRSQTTCQSSTTKTKNGSSSCSTAILPRNRMTHAKVRAAKFQPKSNQDWVGIFGSTVAAATTSSSSSSNK
jgi:hypothetical protein